MRNACLKTRRVLVAFIFAHILLFGQSELRCSSDFQIFYEGQIDRGAALESLKTVDLERYPNAGVVRISQHDKMSYHENGTFQTWQERYVKILTEEGKQGFKSLFSSLSEQYNTTEFKFVEIIKGDDSVVPVDLQKNTQVGVDSAQMDKSIYDPKQKTMQVNIPQLEIGDTVHFIITDNHFKAQVPGTWGYFINLEGSDPIIQHEFTVVAPKNMPLQKIATKSEIAGSISHSVEEEGDRIVYKWVARDVPMAFSEPNMPAFYTQTQRLLVSTISDWAWISRWYWKLSEPHIKAISPELKKKVFQIIPKKGSPDAKINAIFKWVSQEIRYLGLTVEKESPGYEPHPAKMTFERRAGVCRDKAALLTAMLRVAGFEAYPALIMTGPRMEPEVPLPFFDHAITALRKPDGSYLLMDATDETTKEWLPSYLDNKSFLVAKPDGDILRTTPVRSADQNMMVIETKGELGNDGIFRAESVFNFNGINDNYYRGYLSDLTPPERRQYFEKVINAHSFSAEIKKFELTPENLTDTSAPLRVKLTLEAEGMQILGNEAGMLKLPFIGNKIGTVHLQVKKSSLEKRKYPLATGFACGTRETFDLKLNQTVSAPISLPEFKGIQNEAISWHQRVSLKDHNLAGESLFQMKLPEYSPEQYIMLRDAFGQIELNKGKMVVFRASRNSESTEEWWRQFKSDAVVLEEKNAYELKDSHNWTVSKYIKLKILTPAGKGSYSDIRIAYNPAWESVSLKKAQVFSPSGKILKVNDHETNVMDADWVGEAPRYPAGKILVVSFPGVEIGSTIEFEFLRTFQNQPFFAIDGGLSSTGSPFYANDGVFRYFEPLVKKTLMLKYPKAIQMQVLKTDTGAGVANGAKGNGNGLIEQKHSEDGDFTNIEFTATRIAPAVKEKNLPSWHSFNPVVLASSGIWSGYAADLNKQLEELATPTPQIKDAARKLTNQKSEIEKVRAIRDFVAKNTTKVDISIKAIHGVGISQAEETLVDGYGHSIDRAVLLFALLKEAGFEPEFVMSTWPTKVDELWKPLEKIPTRNWFDHLLVRVEVDGVDIYLNDTNQYAKLGTTDSDGYPGLFLRRGAVEKIRVSSGDLESFKKVRYDIKLKDNGAAVVKVTNLFYGTYYQSFHKTCAEITPENRRRRHLANTVSISQRAVATGKYITDCETYPASETFTVEIENFAVFQGGFCYLRLPGLAEEIKYAKAENRVNPISLDDLDNWSIKLVLEMPAGRGTLDLSPPDSFDLVFKESGMITYRSGWTDSSAQLSEKDVQPSFAVEQIFKLKSMILNPADYKQLREYSRFLANPASRTLLLKLPEVSYANTYQLLN